MFRFLGGCGYRRVARPLLFCLSGDTAHALMLTLVRALDALCWGWYFLTLGPIRVRLGLWLQRAAAAKDIAGGGIGPDGGNDPSLNPS